MPKTSERTRIIQYLEATILINLLEDSSDNETDSDIDDVLTPEELLALVHTQRYLEPRTPMPKSRDWSENVLPNYDDGRFRQTLRVSRYAFNFILHSIKSHSIFQNNSSVDQFPVEKQLLFRFGRFGNAASLADVANTFGVSEGTVVKSTERVIKAILSLEDTYLCWYRDDDEAIAMKNRIYAKSGFSNCLGFLDGTTIVLAEKPVKDGEQYFNRKSSYGLNCQIVADLDARIRFFFLGYAASVHDSRCIEESELCGNPEKFFNNGDYVLADSAYTLSKNILTPFKKPASLQPENACFNEIFSSVRVRVEHCIGILKNRFQSLKGMRQRLSGKKTAKSIVHWVKACAIIHNMVLEMDQWDGNKAGKDIFNRELTTINAITENVIVEDTVVVSRRELMKKQVLQYNYS